MPTMPDVCIAGCAWGSCIEWVAFWHFDPFVHIDTDTRVFETLMFRTHQRQHVRRTVVVQDASVALCVKVRVESEERSWCSKAGDCSEGSF